MTEQEAITIAIDFWLKREKTPIVKTIARFREDKNQWNIILDINPADEDDFVVIIVNVTSREASIFGML